MAWFLFMAFAALCGTLYPQAMFGSRCQKAAPIIRTRLCVCDLPQSLI
jgi:hypothetical protein